MKSWSTLHESTGGTKATSNFLCQNIGWGKGKQLESANEIAKFDLDSGWYIMALSKSCPSKASYLMVSFPHLFFFQSNTQRHLATGGSGQRSKDQGFFVSFQRSWVRWCMYSYIARGSEILQIVFIIPWVSTSWGIHPKIFILHDLYFSDVVHQILKDLGWFKEIWDVVEINEPSQKDQKTTGLVDELPKYAARVNLWRLFSSLQVGGVFRASFHVPKSCFFSVA